MNNIQSIKEYKIKKFIKWYIGAAQEEYKQHIYRSGGESELSKIWIPDIMHEAVLEDKEFQLDGQKYVLRIGDKKFRDSEHVFLMFDGVTEDLGSYLEVFKDMPWDPFDKDNILAKYIRLQRKKQRKS